MSTDSKWLPCGARRSSAQVRGQARRHPTPIRRGRDEAGRNTPGPELRERSGGLSRVCMCGGGTSALFRLVALALRALAPGPTGNWPPGE